MAPGATAIAVASSAKHPLPSLRRAPETTPPSCRSAPSGECRRQQHHRKARPECHGQAAPINMSSGGSPDRREQRDARSLWQAAWPAYGIICNAKKDRSMPMKIRPMCPVRCALREVHHHPTPMAMGARTTDRTKTAAPPRWVPTSAPSMMARATGRGMSFITTNAAVNAAVAEDCTSPVTLVRPERMKSIANAAGGVRRNPRQTPGRRF